MKHNRKRIYLMLAGGLLMAQGALAGDGERGNAELARERAASDALYRSYQGPSQSSEAVRQRTDALEREQERREREDSPQHNNRRWDVVGQRG